METQEKRCTKCLQLKSFTDFYSHPLGKDGLRAACKKCCNTQSRTYEQAKPNPERVRNSTLVRKYGITQNDYSNMLSAQGGVCAICKGPQNGNWNSFHVDHCHEDRINRGLLCFRCNSAIGNFLDSPEILRAAFEYIERHHTEHHAN